MSVQVFTLPDLGEGLTEAELVRWLVKVGDPVAVDAPVAEVETAKATVEVPSPYAGVVAARHGEEGATLAVGEPLISVAPSAEANAYVEEERAGSGNVLIGYGTTDAAPSRRRRRAATKAAASPRRDGDRPAVVSPIVRQLARRTGVDLEALTGSGPDGLITRRDVEAAAVAEEQAAGDVDARTGLPIRARVPLTGVRKAVAETLTRSRAEIPEATTWVDVDATALLDLRAQLAETGQAPGILAMVARFVIAGLARFPELNARVDTRRGEITHLDGVNLGLAAQTDRGLVVPAITGAHRLGMRGLDAEIRRLTAAARAGTATAAELSSSSFTLNNYGVLGVDGSAAIINHPEVAILGMGRIIPRPWVVGGEVVARQIAQLSLVFDHRVCDGGTAGGFLRYVADAIESPTSAMADL
ncbi:dihydrolipoamide acetyltransferase family protein [Amycolatopsis thermoflava]|uniref:Dihydrolipoamide acetyltransferase component of pyruvate dehydrogenase complex n=1 Tax=Amycolatopsis thermoflava TaxID=84480 RepID=A0A3N2H8P4_9PSEU|nr:dihydrolipoamide acetyltransferase family protein [Amycolatopsis thermoflava]ROS44700.1 pyruvate dehydrogenase E2 component (dihydrolipoamide acetyltransferase) [Amycolatopsis thermoflava]